MVMHDVPWSGYESILASRGESAVPRLTYADGTLEITSPSRSHESLKSRIRRLVEVFLLHHSIEFEPSARGRQRTRRNFAAQLRGACPDECYLLGDDRSRDRPDLAIELNWTNGGIDKMDAYARLVVPEVWIWNDAQISIHVLKGERYQQVQTSACLPAIDLVEVAGIQDAEVRA